MRDSIDQARDQRDQSREEPQPPPQRTRGALDHLVPAEAAVPIERTRDSPAAAALVELEAAVCTARLLGVVEHHGRLVAARTQARRDKRQRWELHDLTSVAWRPSSPRPQLCLSPLPNISRSNYSGNPIRGKISSPVGEADRAMQSVSPILIAACAQKEPSGSFSYVLIKCADEV